MSELVLSNARVVLANDVVTGSVLVRDGKIADIDTRNTHTGEDFGGDYLIPGLVELHTDHLENHYRPRPGVFWDPLAALHAHDVQISGSGITTVFDAVRIGSDIDLPNMFEHSKNLVEAVRAGPEQGWLRAEHFLHLRCELPSHDVVEHFEAFADHSQTRLASVMDHTPGQRQFRSLEDYKRFYAKHMGQNEEQMLAYINARQAEHDRYSAPNRKAIVARAHELGLALASHDDATLAQVEEAAEDGISIAEFPTTLEAAAAAHDAGQAVLMGAPNVVRGKSHSGNISASDLVAAGLLDILSSDYVPFALLQAVFILPQRLQEVSLPQALATVTRNPAEAAGLVDRGEIAIGKRADLVRVSGETRVPAVRAVWKRGDQGQLSDRPPGVLVLVIGPSGVGKDTLITGARQALDADKRFSFVRRLVTRPTDLDVEDHLSIEPDEFADALLNGRLALHWEAHGLNYALPIGVDTDLALGRIVVANVSRHVVPAAIAKYPNCHVLMITAEISLRAERLSKRGRENRDQITARLAREGAALPAAVSPVMIDNSSSVGIGVTAFVMALRKLADE